MIYFSEMGKRNSEGEEDSAKKRLRNRSPVSGTMYLTPQELHARVRDNANDYLLIDTRSRNDFLATTVISDRCLNIPVAEVKV